VDGVVVANPRRILGCARCGTIDGRGAKQRHSSGAENAGSDHARRRSFRFDPVHETDIVAHIRGATSGATETTAATAGGGGAPPTANHWSTMPRQASIDISTTVF